MNICTRLTRDLLVILPARVRYLRGDVSVKCGSADHRLVLWSVGLPMFVLYVMGLPLGVFVGLKLNKKTAKRVLTVAKLQNKVLTRTPTVPSDQPDLERQHLDSKTFKRVGLTRELPPTPPDVIRTHHRDSTMFQGQLTSEEQIFQCNYGFLIAGAL